MGVTGKLCGRWVSELMGCKMLRYILNTGSYEVHLIKSIYRAACGWKYGGKDYALFLDQQSSIYHAVAHGLDLYDEDINPCGNCEGIDRRIRQLAL